MSEFVPVLVENDAPAPRPGPGGRLQAARLERQLDVAAVAAALRVAPRLVTAMEEDHFAEFDAPVYARGTLRSYARFLNLPVDEVLAAYDEVVGSVPVPTLLPPASARPLPRDYSPLIKAGVLVMTLLLVGASYWWWMGRVAPPAPPVATITTAPTVTPVDSDAGADFPTPAPESLTLAGTSDSNGIPSAPSTAVTAPPPGAVSAPIVTPAPAPAPAPASAPSAAKAIATPVPAAAKAIATPAPVVPKVAAPPTPIASKANITPSTPSGPASAASEAPGAVVGAPAHATAAVLPFAAPGATAAQKSAPLVGQPPPSLVTPVADGAQIVLRGKKDCWVEVRAAGGARLFYGLVRPGETHTMPGPAPWFVYLGYADGVELSVAGHVVDIPASRREGAKARFGLAADGTLR